MIKPLCESEREKVHDVLDGGNTRYQLERAKVGLQIFSWYLQRFKKIIWLVPLTTGIADDLYRRVVKRLQVIYSRYTCRVDLYTLK